MSDQISQKPIIGSPLSGLGSAKAPAHQLEAYFQVKPPLQGDGDCAPCLHEEAGDSPGLKLPNGYDDARLQDEGLTLLAKLGCRLAAFKGTGVVYVEKGKARLQSFVPLKVHQLWHRFVDYHGTAVPAEPKAAPFLAIADECGNIHAMGGLTEGFSALLHDKATGGWLPVDTGFFPKDHIGALGESPCIQLTGYRPLDALGTEEVRRDLEVLGGVGLILMSKMQAPVSEVGSCCEQGTQSVAKVLPYPSEPGPWVLCFEDGEVSWQPKEAPATSSGCCCCCKEEDSPTSYIGNI